MVVLLLGLWLVLGCDKNTNNQSCLAINWYGNFHLSDTITNMLMITDVNMGKLRPDPGVISLCRAKISFNVHQTTQLGLLVLE